MIQLDVFLMDEKCLMKKFTQEPTQVGYTLKQHGEKANDQRKLFKRVHYTIKT